MKKIIQKDNTKVNTLKTKTFEEVLNKASKNETFRNAYREEVFRLKMASEIKKLRLQNKLTQETFAERVEMPQSVIARIESGKYNISLVTLNRVAEALGKQVQLV